MSETSTVCGLPGELAQALGERVAQGQIDLPVLPDVASQVIQACMEPQCDLRALSALVQRDASMTAHMLRVCNSAMYAGSSRIVSVQQAVSRLGLKRVQEIALLVACETKVFRVPGFDLEVRQLFRHSLAAAAFAREIARQRRWNVEEAFLSGLLHDVGRPVLLQAIVSLREELGVDAPRAAVLEATGLHHAEVGAQLIASWNLPERLAEVVLFHHDPTSAPQAARMAMVTRLADDLSHFAMEDGRVAEEDLRAHPLAEPLNVYPDEMDALLERCEHVVEIVESLV